MWKLFLPILFGVNMVHYWLITPDGSKFLLESPKWNVELHIPDGFDLPPLTHDTQSVYKQPGAQLKSIKVQPRQVSLVCNLNACSRDELHDLRQKLWRYVRWNTTTNDSPPDPLILRYDYKGQQADLFVYLLSENVTSLGSGDDKTQAASINLIAYDPMWYRVQATTPSWDETDTQKQVTLATQYQFTATRIVGKLSGLWNNLGGGANGTVNAIAIAPDGTVYAGGAFTSIGGVAANRIAKWDGTTWSALGTGASSTVLAIAIGPDGSVYAGGSFATAGGVAVNSIAKWDGATWSALGAGMNAAVSALAFAPDTATSGPVSMLHAGGEFTTAGGGAANRIAKWDGATWSALDTGLNGAATSLVTAPDGALYVGGAFTTAGGVTVNRIAKWKNAAWSALGSGMSGNVNALALGRDGTLYAGGVFATAGGITVNCIAQWNGTAWQTLNADFDYNVFALAVASDGTLYAGGYFTTAGGLSLADRIAVWNGSTWSQIDIDLPGLATIYAIATYNKNIYLGFDTTGTATASGSLTNISQQGDADAFPIFSVVGPGTLQWIENIQSSKRIKLNLYINAGETVTIDLSPGVKTVTSDWRGNLMPYSPLLPLSDFASFSIPPDPVAPSGISTINLMITSVTGATTATMEYREPFLSADGAVTP